MNKFASGLTLPEKAPRTTLKSEILWGCELGGSPHFPKDLAGVHDRFYASAPRPLETFRRAVMDAVERVLIMDDYFLMPDKGEPAERLWTVLDWLHPRLAASDIRILTKKHAEIDEELLQLFRDREEEINNQARRGKRCSIQVNTRLREGFNYVHDRFAIVDDELWHFGATVGGFHASVNAASRGWSAADAGAIEFFDLAWQMCKEK
ncbi:UNVERIFIED_ORG: hypothetical protein J2W38_007047 [Variovorax paradoxus]|nr:hypothetical protein [Variovorax paradoxus]